ncbi:MAG: low specificity L-threonine aldolase [Candidatus Eremiobacteraeota bacterium]|nr:low specificity L-threonine aldolase [Candidatus Eremiobacteraeota bacterium]
MIETATTVIDLFSDTATKPSAGMRRAMADAEVGDEQRREDPTVNRLQAAVAELLGKEAALFLPSGTMCNLISFAVATKPGDEIILHRTAHPIVAEGGGTPAVSGALFCPQDGPRGMFTLEQVTASLRAPSRYSPRSRVVSIEQTTNLGGGAVWPLERIAEICTFARQSGLWTHCDGARLLNAVVASGVPAAKYGAHFDSIWIDFSKGLGAPVGAVLAGSRTFIEDAWYFKQRFGGAMRQAGVIAAACLYALDHNVERLAEDHANARIIHDAIRAVPRLQIEDVETNIVIFDVAGLGVTAADVESQLGERHVRLSVMGKTKLRAVTHLDVNRAQVESAARTLATTLMQLR